MQLASEVFNISSFNKRCSYSLLYWVKFIATAVPSNSSLEAFCSSQGPIVKVWTLCSQEGPRLLPRALIHELHLIMERVLPLYSTSWH